MPPGVFLTDEDAAQLDFVLNRALAVLLNRDGMVPGVLVRFARDVHEVADRFRTAVLVNPGSGTGSIESGPVTGVSCVAEQLTTQQVARLAGCSDSYVRRCVNRGALPGVRTTGGGWLIDSGHVAVWLAERSNTKAA
jgi:excisionase family DNA binding protein